MNYYFYFVFQGKISSFSKLLSLCSYLDQGLKILVRHHFLINDLETERAAGLVDRAEPRAIPGAKHADGTRTRPKICTLYFLLSNFLSPIVWSDNQFFWTKLGAFILVAIGFPFLIQLFTAVISIRY